MAQRHLVELTRNQFTICPESKKRKDGPEIQQAKERTMAESIPFKYGNKNSTNLPQITIKCTDADGKENKEECPIFADGTQHEVLIQTIETIFVLGNRYNWKEGKEKLYYQNFGRALKGQPSKKWEGLLESVRAKTFDNFKSKVIELVEEIMGEDVHKDQIKYLTETPQPTNLATTKWCDRVAVINAGLVFLKKGAKLMSEEEVINTVITASLKPEFSGISFSRKETRHPH